MGKNIHVFQFFAALVLMLGANMTFAQNTTPIEACVGSPLKLGVNWSAENPTGPAGSTYVWSVDPTLPTGVTVTPTGNQFLINWNGIGVGNQYTIRVIETANSCEGAPQLMVVNVRPTPIAPTVVADNSSVCSLTDAVFTITGTAGSTVSYTLNGQVQTTTLEADGTKTINANEYIDSNYVGPIELIISSSLIGDCRATIDNPSTATIIVNSRPITTAIQVIP